MNFCTSRMCETTRFYLDHDADPRIFKEVLPLWDRGNVRILLITVTEESVDEFLWCFASNKPFDLVRIRITIPDLGIFNGIFTKIFMPRPLGGGIKRCCASDVWLSVWRLSDVWRLSVCRTGLSREQRPKEVQNWHRGSPRHTTGTPLSRSNGQKGPRSSLTRPLGWLYWQANMDIELVTAQMHVWCISWHHFAGLGRGHIVAASRLQLVENDIP